MVAVSNTASGSSGKSLPLTSKDRSAADDLPLKVKSGITRLTETKDSPSPSPIHPDEIYAFIGSPSAVCPNS